ncbi:multicopy suppressor of BFA (Brefeldin A) [Hypoxylon texense]
MSLYTPPPPHHSPDEDKPTLLVCWWITLFCTTIILLRVVGRFIRSEKLFREDKMAALAIIPLYLRMGCVHVILIYGTNNAHFTELTDEEIRRKSIASGLVLASRILYAATLWILKSAILEFFKRLTSITWNRTHEITLLFIRGTLVATFVAVLIADLTECQPFDHYWQVMPDPGGQCRQGYVQLITMATCNILTDLLLVVYPVPIIVTSHMGTRKKVQLTLLFSLSLLVVGITGYRIPRILRLNGNQQIRSLLASVELLFATAAANTLVLGSFVRDRGVKKTKYRHNSTAAESIDRASERRPTLHRHWGSDEDLVRDLGLGVDRELRDAAQQSQADKPPAAKAVASMDSWQFPQRHPSNSARSDDSLLHRDQLTTSRSNSTITPRRVSFFDVGGLLDGEPSRSSVRDSYNSSLEPPSPLSPGSPSPTMQATSNGFRRGSQVLLQDLSGLLSPFNPRQSRSSSRNGVELETIPQHPQEPPDEPANSHSNSNDTDYDLKDVEGRPRKASLHC